MHKVGPDDDPLARAALDVAAYQLAADVPDLIDEIEQLQAERTEGGRPRIRTFVKPDSRGGRA